MFMITVCKLREEQESVMLLIIEGAKACTSTHILFTKSELGKPGIPGRTWHSRWQTTKVAV